MIKYKYVLFMMGKLKFVGVSVGGLGGLKNND